MMRDIQIANKYEIFLTAYRLITFQVIRFIVCSFLLSQQESGYQDIQASTIAILCFINSYVTDNIHFKWRLHFVWPLTVQPASEIIELMLPANEYANNDAVSLGTTVYNSPLFGSR